MNCRTPGCHTPYPENDPERRFCERCGWPLAEGLVSALSEVVAFQGHLPATLKVRADNRGAGRLVWKVEPVSRGVVVTEDPLEVPGGAHGVATLSVDPGQVVDEVLEVSVRLWDRVGTSSLDLRPADREACWREERLRLPVRRQRHGPLTVHEQTLLFGASVTSGGVKVKNDGETDLVVRARVSAGYTLQAPARPRSEQVEATVLGQTCWSLTVATQPGVPPSPGELVLEAENVPPCRVELLPVAVQPAPPPRERWVVAIDFGTTKSAVVVLDRFRLGAEPEPVRWHREGHSEPASWLPSAVEFGRKGRPERFGWEIPLTETGPSIFRSLKMKLREDDQAVRKCIVYFMRRLLEKTAAQFDGIFDSARVVFTLPVLDNGELYEEQRRRTLELALEAGRVYNLSADRIEFHKEPECAAVDFLHRLVQDPTLGTLRNGDWLCVLDMGGGTTDVTFARVEVQAGGNPSFEELHSFGYENHAGDRVDLELYGWAIDHWTEQKRIKSVPGEKKSAQDLGREALLAAGSLQLDGEKFAYDRPRNLNQVQGLKERIYGTAPPREQKWEEFARSENHVLMAPGNLAPVMRGLGDRVFVEGLHVDGRDIPSVRAAMEDLGLPADRIAFLCLTGGTSQIPDFESHLREVVAFGGKMRTLVDRQDIRMNVVLGAVRRPALRIQGTLPCDLVLTFSFPDGRRNEKRVLSRGSVPGADKTEHEFVAPGETVHVGVRAEFLEKPPKVLFSCPVFHDPARLDPPLPLHLKSRLVYGTHGALRLQMAWETQEPLPEPLPSTSLPSLPCQ